MLHTEQGCECCRVKGRDSSFLRAQARTCVMPHSPGPIALLGSDHALLPTTIPLEIPITQRAHLCNRPLGLLLINWPFYPVHCQQQGQLFIEESVLTAGYLALN